MILLILMIGTHIIRMGMLSNVAAIAYGILVMVPWYALMGLPVWNPAAPWPF